MKARFFLSATAFVMALVVVVLLALRTQSLHTRLSSLELQMASLKSTGTTHTTASDAPQTVPDNAAPVVTSASVNLAAAIYEPGDSYPQAPANLVPVHVVAKQTTLHPGLAYDVFNDGDQPLDLRVTLVNPIRMTKIFDCHVMPGRGSYCEIGFDQGFSGTQGDTLTIEAFNFSPLVVTP